jgi:sugar lactone lactonase YvrE
MSRVFNVLTVVALVALSIVPAVAAQPRQVGVLQHFASLPAGLIAEGLVIRGGHFYVSTISFTAADGTILVFNRDGNIEQRITVPGLPIVGQLAFANNTTLYAVAGNLNTGSGAIVLVRLDTGKVTTFATGFQLPNGLALDNRGNLYVTDLLAGTVSKVTPDGTVSIFASGPLLGTALVRQLGLKVGPNDLAFGKDGRTLYITDLGLGTVVKVTVQKDGTASAPTSFANVPFPDGIAFDITGQAYVTSPLTNTIQLISPDGSMRKLSLDTTHESLNNPSNLAFIGRQLYITDLGLIGNPEISVVTVELPGLPVKG